MFNSIVSSNNANLPTGQRVPISQADYDKYVAAAVANRLTAKLPFTAWDITRAIRVQYPGLEIVHDEVRGILHLLMASENNWVGDYADFVLPDGTSRHAVQYTYLPLTTIDTAANAQVSTPPAASLNPGQIAWDE